MSTSTPKPMYGLTAVPATPNTLLTNKRPTQPPSPTSVQQTPIPNTPLAQRINSYAHHHLPEETYNHSLRVYHYGQAIKAYRFPASQFPEWHFDDETYFLACVLHDIGTTRENLRATRLSFEFYGGLLALRVLQDVNATHSHSHAHSHAGVNAGADSDEDKVEIRTGTGIGVGASSVGGPAATTTATNANAAAPREQAESVAEAIIRHQDLCHVGKMTAVGQLLQLATIFDNTGAYADLVHADTIKDEIELKPWAHSTALGEEFEQKVLGNRLMEPYE
ncbi:hypothetical protein PENANT_c002G00712 [Penicillium antarcticum]|uniref:HD/PDEase domain-containing protein n=1 Tax=Penicillium antarcticum TaxID=416450 RepID=A0A1V6QL30_9EURO|nr:hypothetical protein PENANT_c002G00712 [Penicillium antarcticum]